MILSETEAFILYSKRQSDSRWRLTLFSREMGRLTAYMRTSNTKKCPLVLEPFVPMWFELHAKNTWVQVKQMNLMAPPFLLNGEALWAGWYVNELLVHLLLDNDPFHALYDDYLQTITQLSTVSNRAAIEKILRPFEWNLLQTLGYGISLALEGRSAQPIEANRYYQYVPEVGLVEATTGLSGKTCLALSRGEWTDLENLTGAKYLMRVMLDHLLEGQSLKTRELFRKIQG